MLRGALVDVLTHIGVDDVSALPEAELTDADFDAAIVSNPTASHPAHVVIETPLNGLTVGHVHADGDVMDVALAHASDLLDALDKYCPTTVARAAIAGQTDTGGGHR
jgi:hypothetical protein